MTSANSACRSAHLPACRLLSHCSFVPGIFARMGHLSPDFGAPQIHCDYECAKFLPTFFPACSHIISAILGAQKVQGYESLQKTCAALPKRALIAAVSGIILRETCSASSS